jgi:N4-(beta-N-acetylglucosaminyl)-L-asparaginase
MSELSRRSFLGTTSLVAAAALAGSREALAQPAAATKPVAASNAGDNHRGPCVIASSNGLAATVRARQLIDEGYDPADAVVQGVRIMEDDPNDDSVGLGGLPNAEGIVELDASVMHGPTHKSGAVGGIRDIKNPAMVALMVLRLTDHCLLVGEGARRFAIDHGFRPENLLTEKARLEWLDWKHNMSKHDDWLDDAEQDAVSGKQWKQLPWQDEKGNDKQADPNAPRLNDGSQMPKKTSLVVPHRWRIHEVTGTVHCSAVTPKGDISSVTSTSGLNWKIPGRVGDSPIIGAGNYCDNAVGAGGCTGRGEAAIVNLAAFRIVDLMSRGMTPSEAAMAVAKTVADHTKEKRLLTPEGRPNFNVRFYALRKDGAYGCATIYSGHQFAVHDSTGARLVNAPSLYDAPTPPQP